ncbi:hypothetical protein JCM11251_003354 [Rhodosporidiobolus azoricus]
MRSPVALLVLAISFTGAVATFEVGGEGVVGRDGLGGAGGSIADHLLLSRQFGNGNGSGGRNSDAASTQQGDGTRPAGDTSNGGAVEDQAQDGDAATAVGGGNAADGQGQQNSTATTGQEGNNAAGGGVNGGDNNDGATAGGGVQQGNPPPADIVDTGDPQKNLFLDPSQVARGLALDGQQVPADNQVASATSVNNFINACLLRTDLPLTNGNQVIGGSCNAVPMGIIAAQNRAPSSKFTNPANLDVIPPDTTFTIEMAINNLITGNFVNAQQNYFSAPQATGDNGIIIGHSHVVIEQIDSLTSQAVTNPQEFAFFKGFNAAAQGGVLSAVVDGGLPEGTYKMSSINSAANHQPALVGVAQHGSLDDAVYFIASNDPDALAKALNIQGAAANNENANTGAGAGADGADDAAAGSGDGSAGNDNAAAGGATSGNGAAENGDASAGNSDSVAGGGDVAQASTSAAASDAATTSAAAGGDIGGGGRGGGSEGGVSGNRSGRNSRFSRTRFGGRNSRRSPSDSSNDGVSQSFLEKRLAALVVRESKDEMAGRSE